MLPSNLSPLFSINMPARVLTRCGVNRVGSSGSDEEPSLEELEAIAAEQSEDKGEEIEDWKLVLAQLVNLDDELGLREVPNSEVNQDEAGNKAEDPGVYDPD